MQTQQTMQKTARDTARETKDKLNGTANKIQQEATHALKDFADSALDLKDRVQKASSEAVDSSIEFVKKYPLYTALGAAAVGVIAGMLMRRPNSKH